MEDHSDLLGCCRYCDYLYSLVVEDANSLATSLPLASANVKGKDKPAGKKPHKGSAKEAGHKDGVLSAEAVSFLQEVCKAAHLLSPQCDWL